MSKRILVVDDDRQMVRTLADILAMHGWNAERAYSGEEAVAAVAKDAFDAVLMDVKMSGVNGVDAFKAMKAIRPDIRVVLMTAYSAGDLIAEAEREGALSVLRKPVALPGLIEMLNGNVSEARRVLVVDDEPGFLRTLGDVLRHHGYVVLEAQSLTHAIAQLERSSPGAVILDLRLQDTPPTECVLAIKRVSPAVALILYSGHPAALDAVTHELPRPLISGTLRKPFAPDCLLELLDAAFA
jgi:DNA-binding NtrC family response regulator